MASGRQIRVFEGALHGESHAGTVLVGGRHVEGVAGSAVAHDLGVDFRAAGLGVLEPLKHEETAAFAADEAVALGVKGP